MTIIVVTTTISVTTVNAAMLVQTILVPIVSAAHNEHK